VQWLSVLKDEGGKDRKFEASMVAVSVTEGLGLETKVRQIVERVSVVWEGVVVELARQLLRFQVERVVQMQSCDIPHDFFGGDGPLREKLNSNLESPAQKANASVDSSLGAGLGCVELLRRV